MKTSLVNKRELEKLIDIKRPLVVCVSTGIDSMCLFHMLYSYGFKCIVAHVNHKRRIESDQEFEWLKNHCQSKEVPFEGFVIEEEISSDFQEKARYIRYSFFKEIARKYNTNQICLAHQADDMAETIIMRISRGTSIKGYQGIKDIFEDNGYRIIRPLLYTTREKIEKYQKENDITYFEDQSNSTDHYTRNLVRHHVLPILKRINPSFHDSFNHYREDLREMSELVIEHSSSFMDSHSKETGNEIILDRLEFNKQKEIIKKGILLLSLNRISKDTVELKHERQAEIISLSMESSESKEVNLTDEISVFIEYGDISFMRKTAIQDINIQLNGEGTISIDNLGVIETSHNFHSSNDKNTYVLCYNDTDAIYPITVRYQKAGDRINYGGKTKKISDLFKEHKVPRRYRNSIPLFINSSGEIFFIPGIIRKETDWEKKEKLYITFSKEKEKWN